MNYLKIYNQLIDRASVRKLSNYTENHHIVPRCLGGTDNVTNLVKLTPEEHYLAHQLLVKIYPANKKIIYAAHMMTVGLSESRRNKSYGWVRRKMAESMTGPGNHMYGKKLSDERKAKSGKKGIENHMHGKHHSAETRKKISDANRGCAGLSGPLNGMFGKKHNQTTKDRISKNNPWTGTAGSGKHFNSGRKMADSTKEYLRNLFTGVTLTEETKEKMRKPKGAQLIVSCPHCQKSGGVSNMNRYHFNNCKNK